MTDRYEEVMREVQEDYRNIIEQRFLKKFGATTTVEKCQSPIEKILYIALFHRLTENRELFEIKPQKKIKRDNTYILVDFEIIVNAWYINETTGEEGYKNYSLLVECDGHDYHEKTKEQAAKDKSRDRFLASKGYHVLRFTGSEIYNKPHKCANEIVKFISEKTSEFVVIDPSKHSWSEV